MILLRDIKGQDNAMRFLSNSLYSGRIAHSYLFFGQEGTGRALAAKAFITALVCPSKISGFSACGKCSTCRRVSMLEYPDVAWIKPERNTAIKIEEIRKIRDLLSLKPYEAPVNICVIEDAHMMTEEASNALLKVLEEPPLNSMLILITDKKELLLPTVVSRCLEVRFHVLSIEDTKDIILGAISDIDEEDAYLLAHFSQGSPGRALFMIDEGIEKEKNKIIAFLNEVVKEKNADCFSWLNEDKDRLLEDLEMLIMFFRDIALGKEGIEEMVLNKNIIDTGMYNFFKTYSFDKIYKIIESLINMKSALIGNVNPRLAAQVLPGQIWGSGLGYRNSFENSVDRT